MRKIIFILMILFSISISKQVMGKTTYFKWNKTVIKVPLGSDLNEYVDDYQVELVVDGVNSADYYVEKETNCSSFSTVLTNRCGKYTVYYQAVSLTYNLRSEVAITFLVVDEIPPDVIVNQTVIEVQVGQTLDILKHLTISDNYSAYEKLNIIVDDTQVQYTMLGSYPLYVSVSDEANNLTTKELQIKIVDDIKPSIRQIKAFVVNYQEPFVLSNYFLAFDNFDGNITEKLKISEYNLSLLGEQTVSLSVKDSSGNLMEASFELSVVDNSGPTLKLLSNEISLPINEFINYDEAFFQNYIATLTDNCGVLELVIDYHALKPEIGYYQVTYLAKDINLNETYQVLYVRLIAVDAPKITARENLVFKVGEPIDFLSLVEVSDSSDSLVASRLEIVANAVDIWQAGTYPITYRCYNSSGLEASLTIEVTIVDNNQKEDNFDYGIYIFVGCVVVSIFVFWYLKKRFKQQ